jgi:molybdopterin-containing oxidoreductase family membrane subunit
VCCVALAAVVLLGVYAFVRQTAGGHINTGLTDASPWGLYVVGYVVFVGVATGATLVGLMIHGFGREEYAPLGTRAILIAFLSLVAAVLFVSVDVGSISRMMNVPVVWHNATSLFNYTSTSYYLFGLVLLVQLFYTVRLTRGRLDERGKKRAKWMAIVAVPLGLIALQAPHGALFAVVKAREFWNTALLPPHFVVVALITATSVMLVVAIATSALAKRELIGKRTLAQMGGWLAIFITIAAFFDVFDFLISIYGDTDAENDATRFLSSSNLPFSIVHIAGYVLALGILMTRRGREAPWLVVAAVLAMAATIAYRYSLVTVGLAVPLLQFLQSQTYWPSPLELLLSAGIVALVTLVYLVATKILPMEEDRAIVDWRGDPQQEAESAPIEEDRVPVGGRG